MKKFKNNYYTKTFKDADLALSPNLKEIKDMYFDKVIESEEGEELYFIRDLSLQNITLIDCIIAMFNNNFDDLILVRHESPKVKQVCKLKFIYTNDISDIKSQYYASNMRRTKFVEVKLIDLPFTTDVVNGRTGIINESDGT